MASIHDHDVRGRSRAARSHLVLDGACFSSDAVYTWLAVLFQRVLVRRATQAADEIGAGSRGVTPSFLFIGCERGDPRTRISRRLRSSRESFTHM